MEKLSRSFEVRKTTKLAVEHQNLNKTQNGSFISNPIKKTKEYWHMLGPGLTTGASDDDPSGIATYSQTGAQYGYQLLWLAVFTFPFMAVVQEMCARIGLVTGRGLAANIRLHYPRWVLYTCTALLFLANTLNIGANLGAMAKGVQLLWPAANFSFLVVGFTVLCLALQIFSTYASYARILKYLALVLLAYIFSGLSVSVDWGSVLAHATIPTLSFTREQIFLVCGILGTTISPYLFFWQTSQEVEEEILHGKTSIILRQQVTSEQEITRMRVDVWSGMFLSNLVMFFIIMTCAATLFSAGITNIDTAADAALALKPIAGNAAYVLFALGIIGTGLLAVPVLAGSASYAMSESFGWKEGLYRKWQQAHAFYGVIIISMLVGLLLNFIGLDPIKALIYSAVANGLVAPVVLVLIVSLSSNRKVMGDNINGRSTKLVGYFIICFMGLASLATVAAVLF
jgi:NRAMP (natural resistance-associated macrophage protein)-like metal ion transporter